MASVLLLQAPRFSDGVLDTEVKWFEGQFPTPYRSLRDTFAENLDTDLPGRKLPTFQGDSTDLPGRKVALNPYGI